MVEFPSIAGRLRPGRNNLHSLLKRVMIPFEWTGGGSLCVLVGQWRRAASLTLDAERQGIGDRGSSSHTYRTHFPVRFLCLSFPRPLVPVVIPRRWLFGGPASVTYPRPRSRWRSCPRLEAILLLAASGGCQRGPEGTRGWGGWV